MVVILGGPAGGDGLGKGRRMGEKERKYLEVPVEEG